ncbi:hypothetical protein ACIP98_34530 [Streptomyces sp. NPDC088354]|uniref:hypothetical protein n=1 Tax=unclassified Streptomyces TaxID=2593676 RepID=UPI00299FD815|nr:hypothetical protein [Streptomyces sp. MI02-7b]MDX3074047.1 hypothetical protein [Streptomyces sp. MI02-7b]
MEVDFSVVQRKVVSPDDFTELTKVGDRLRADLDDQPDRLDRRTADHQEESPPVSSMAATLPSTPIQRAGNDGAVAMAQTTPGFGAGMGLRGVRRVSCPPRRRRRR